MHFDRRPVEMQREHEVSRRSNIETAGSYANFLYVESPCGRKKRVHFRDTALTETAPAVLTFRQIEAFRAMMTCGTTTRAAEIMRISQPAVSRLLAEIEHAVRLKLFDRGKGRIRPTAEAYMFYEEVQRAFVGLDRLHFAAENIRSFSSGTLRIASLPALGHAFLPRAIAAFRRRYPGSSILLNIRSSEAVKDLVKSGQFDVGFAADEISVTGVRSEVFTSPAAVCVVPAVEMHEETRLLPGCDV